MNSKKNKQKNMSWPRKYGVNIFINEIYVNVVDFPENIKTSDFQYIVDIVDVYVDNGNGTKYMKIYSEGKLDVLQVGNWKISSIVKMPFNWTGFDDVIEMCDSDSQIIKIRATPDSGLCKLKCVIRVKVKKILPLPQTRLFYGKHHF